MLVDPRGLQQNLSFFLPFSFPTFVFVEPLVGGFGTRRAFFLQILSGIFFAKKSGDACKLH